ncbi:MAG: hypothetical protein LBC89_02520 [Bacteroidales bacterium]|nr:hypothetical protein [Bacteroidales bacterium]
MADIPAKFEFNENEMKEHANYMTFYQFKRKIYDENRSFDNLSESEILQLETILPQPPTAEVPQWQEEFCASSMEFALKKMKI